MKAIDLRRIGRNKSLLLVAMGMIVAGILLIVFAWFDRKNDREFSESAVVVEGRVLHKRSETRTNKNEGRPDVFYYVTASFSVGNLEHSFESGVSGEDWKRLEPKDPIKIEYLPDDPARCRILGSGGALGAYLTGAMGALFCFAGGGVLFAGAKGKL